MGSVSLHSEYNCYCMLVFVQLQNDLQECKRRSNLMWPCLQQMNVCHVWNMLNDHIVLSKTLIMTSSSGAAHKITTHRGWIILSFYLYSACREEIHTLLCDRPGGGGCNIWSGEKWGGVRERWWEHALMAEWHRDVVKIIDETLWSGLKPRTLTPREDSLLLWEQQFHVIILGFFHLI